jgi:membrane fusion protein (multidrug efflux system)
MFKNKFFAVVAATIILYSCSEDNEKNETIESFSVATPIKKDTIFNKLYVAEIQAVKKVEIRSRIKGFIDKIHIDEGSYVKEGQLLFSISSQEYADNLNKIKAQLKGELAEKKSLQVELRNVKNLFSKNIVSKSEVEIAEAKIEASEAKCDELQAEISIAELQVSYTKIKAPFSGYINRIPLKIGSLIEEGTLLSTLTDNNEVFSYFKVSETEYLSFVRNDVMNDAKSISMLLADNSRHLEKGTIETMDGEIEKSTGNISIRGRFKNPSNILKHGSTGKIIVPFDINNALLVPMSATFEIQENFYVYVVNKDNKLKLTRIYPGISLGKYYVIEKGLQATDKILLEGIQLVKEGQAIKVKNKI